MVTARACMGSQAPGRHEQNDFLQGPSPPGSKLTGMAADYTVTAQSQTSLINGSGALEDAMFVSFTTIPEGIAGSVVVPLSDYSPETVAAKIEPLVAKIKAVQAL